MSSIFQSSSNKPYEIKNTLLVKALIHGTTKNRDAIASRWEVTESSTGTLKIYHITLLKEISVHDKENSIDYYINIDDCSKNLGENVRIIAVAIINKNLTCYYKTDDTGLVEFDINKVINPNTCGIITKKNKNEKFDKLKKLSPKEIKAIKNFNLKNKKIKKLFKNALRQELENYITESKNVEKKETKEKLKGCDERSFLLSPDNSLNLNYSQSDPNYRGSIGHYGKDHSIKFKQHERKEKKKCCFCFFC